MNRHREFKYAVIPISGTDQEEISEELIRTIGTKETMLLKVPSDVFNYPELLNFFSTDSVHQSDADMMTSQNLLRKRKMNGGPSMGVKCPKEEKRDQKMIIPTDSRDPKTEPDELVASLAPESSGFTDLGQLPVVASTSPTVIIPPTPSLIETFVPPRYTPSTLPSPPPPLRPPPKMAPASLFNRKNSAVKRVKIDEDRDEMMDAVLDERNRENDAVLEAIFDFPTDEKFEIMDDMSDFPLVAKKEENADEEEMRKESSETGGEQVVMSGFDDGDQKFPIIDEEEDRENDRYIDRELKIGASMLGVKYGENVEREESSERREEMEEREELDPSTREEDPLAQLMEDDPMEQADNASMAMVSSMPALSRYDGPSREAVKVEENDEREESNERMEEREEFDPSTGEEDPLALLMEDDPMDHDVNTMPALSRHALVENVSGGKKEKEKEKGDQVAGQSQKTGIKTANKCTKCNKLVAKSNMSIPVWRHHMKTHAVEHTTLKPYQCSVCNEKFVKKEEASRHTRRSCDDAAVVVNSLVDAANELMAEECFPHHYLQPSISAVEHECKCARCGEFVEMDGRSSHIVRVHLKEEVWDCATCEEIFLIKNDCAKHSMNEHSTVDQSKGRQLDIEMNPYTILNSFFPQ